MKVEWRAQLAGLSGYAPERFVLGSLVVGSLLLILWSMTVRLPLLTEAQSTIATTFALQHEVASLQARWDPQEAELVAQEVARAEQRLVQDVTALAGWLQDAHHQAKTLGFRSRHVLDDPVAAPEGLTGIQIQPIHFSLSTAQGSQAFEGVMKVLKWVSDSPVRVDVDGVTLKGEGRGVTAAEAVLHVWMKKEG